MKQPPLTRTLPPSYHKSDTNNVNRENHEIQLQEQKEDTPSSSSSSTSSFKSNPQQKNECYV